MQAHVVSSVGVGNHAQGHLGDSAGRRSATSIELCTHGATSQPKIISLVISIIVAWPRRRASGTIWEKPHKQRMHR